MCSPGLATLISYVNLEMMILNVHFSLYDEDDIFTRKRPPVSRLRQQNQHQVVAPSSSEILSAPHPIVMTQGRKVRTSLQRLQREQDEMFEL